MKKPEQEPQSKDYKDMARLWKKHNVQIKHEVTVAAASLVDGKISFSQIIALVFIDGVMTGLGKKWRDR